MFLKPGQYDSIETDIRICRPLVWHTPAQFAFTHYVNLSGTFRPTSPPDSDEDDDRTQSGFSEATSEAQEGFIEPVAFQRRRQKAEIDALCRRYGHHSLDGTELHVQFATEITRRLLSRAGNDIYQTISFPLTNWPDDFVDRYLSDQAAQIRTGGVLTYAHHRNCKLESLLSMTQTPHFSGLSRGLKTNSQQYIRTVATLHVTSIEISVLPGVGVQVGDYLRRVPSSVHFQAMFLLVDDSGEAHLPKNPNRTDVDIGQAALTNIRKGVFKDIEAMADKGYPLSPAFYHLIGRAAPAPPPPPPPKVPKVPKPKKAKPLPAAEERIEEVIEERPSTGLSGAWYRVRWDKRDYKPEWEAWREDKWEGNVGDPLETWEPRRHISGTRAYAHWCSKQRYLRRLEADRKQGASAARLAQQAASHHKDLAHSDGSDRSGRTVFDSVSEDM